MNVLVSAKACRFLLGLSGAALVALGLLTMTSNVSAQEGDDSQGLQFQQEQFPRIPPGPQPPEIPNPPKGGGGMPGGGRPIQPPFGPCFPIGPTHPSWTVPVDPWFPLGPTFPPVFPDPTEPQPLGGPVPRR
jgi:hypothetical protein